MLRPVIYYVRHGQTDWNAQFRFQGQRDIPLNDTGRQQARDNGRKLAEAIGDPDRFAFYSSPLGRARETMEIIRKAMGLPPEDYRIEDRLIEASYGELEGMAISDIERDRPELMASRQRDRWNFTPPAGESLAMVARRIAPFFDALDGPAVVVAHGAVGRTVRNHLAGAPRETAAHYTFPQDKVFRFENDEEEIF
ncbi:histidine phosphatase family protein [Salaquimonas pukyongi]|uniref:histidine phosphatase family protein n=1 Tax=Salaquimonas pukyongi TaxID=2712698 RepID=UPI00096BAADA|nr:histidine phosphatase family protein [Salaquimonas pukyongi]